MEIIGLNEKVYSERNKKEAMAKDYEKRIRVDNGNSYATETILRTSCDKEIKANPGLKHSILRKYSKKGK